MRRALLMTAPLLLLAAIPARAQEGEDAAKLAAHKHASACVAVLKREALVLTVRHKAGHPETRPEIVRLTEQGFAFIGTAYKNGLRKPQADQLLDEAEMAQKQASPEALRQLLGECQVEGAKLLREANFVERALVGNRAAARVEKMLAPPAEKDG
jgi:hypothetical protein